MEVHLLRIILMIIHLSRIIGKPDFGICENKGTDQLPGS